MLNDVSACTVSCPAALFTPGASTPAATPGFDAVLRDSLSAPVPAEPRPGDRSRPEQGPNVMAAVASLATPLASPMLTGPAPQTEAAMDAGAGRSAGRAVAGDLSLPAGGPFTAQSGAAPRGVDQPAASDAAPGTARADAASIHHPQGGGPGAVQHDSALQARIRSSAIKQPAAPVGAITEAGSPTPSAVPGADSGDAAVLVDAGRESTDRGSVDLTAVATTGTDGVRPDALVMPRESLRVDAMDAFRIAGAPAATPAAVLPVTPAGAPAADGTAVDPDGAVDAAPSPTPQPDGSARDLDDALSEVHDASSAGEARPGASGRATAAYQAAASAPAYPAGGASPATPGGTTGPGAAPGHAARTLAAQGAHAARMADPASAPGSARTVDQVAGALAIQVRDGVTEASIALRPAALGEVKVQITSGLDGLVIRLSAEHEAVGELLRANLGELRTALAGHQVAVSELHVLHNPPAPAAPAAPGQPGWQEQPWARRNQDDPADGRAPQREGDPHEEEQA